MTREVFPPISSDKKGFYVESVYWEAMERYPTVADLVTKKAEETRIRFGWSFRMDALLRIVRLKCVL